MNHRKIHSQGYIPFSWEEKPGISKFNHQKSSSDMGMVSLLSPPPCTCTTLQPPRLSYSGRSLRSKDDPFLAALKSCTKNVSNHREYEVKKQGKILSFSKSNIFSCKKSCDVLETDNLMKFSKLPPIPKERYNAKSFVTRN